MATYSDTEENWLKDQGIDTTYRKIFWAKMRQAMKNRRQYNGPLPEGVEEDRRRNDELHEMQRIVKEIHAGTKKNNSMLKSVMNVFGFAGGEAKRHKD